MIRIEKKCAFPGCEFVLFDLPEKVRYCVPHQLLLQQITLEKDRQFITEHLLGCTLGELAELLEIPSVTLNGYLVNGRLPAIKRGIGRNAPWQIAYEGLVEAIILVRNWVVVDANLARVAQTDLGTLKDYVNAEYFGKSKVHLQGYLSIHKSYIPGIAKRCAEIKRKNANKRGKPYHYLNNDEIAPGKVAKRLRTSYQTVYHWMDMGILKSRRLGREKLARRVTTEADFWEFVQKVSSGRTKVRSRYKERCRGLLEDKDLIFFEP